MNMESRLVLDKSESLESQLERFDQMIKHVDSTPFNGESFINKYALGNDFDVISSIFAFGSKGFNDLVELGDIDKINSFSQALAEYMAYAYKKNKRIWRQIVAEEMRDVDTVRAYLLLRQLSATIYKFE